MKAVTFKLNTVLAGVVGAACLLAVLLRTFAPITAWLPNIDIPCLAAVSILALVIDGYIDGKKIPARCWALTALLAALTFWLLPWASGLVPDAAAAVRMGVIGGVLFTVLTFAYTSIRERLQFRQRQHSLPTVRRPGALPGQPVPHGNTAVSQK